MSVRGRTLNLLPVGRTFARAALPYAVIASSLACASAIMIESPESGVPWLYKGMVVWAFAWAFLDAFTIGANDVANAFANAVGSGTVTHRQACLLACVGELLGVLVLSSNVTDTVRKKMTKVDYFEEDPYVLALGMSCVNLGSGLWVFAATLLSMPVSTTHAVVGATLGIGVAAWGPAGVQWEWKSLKSSGFAGVAASWVISPVMSGVCAALIYLSLKYIVLNYEEKEAQRRTLRFMPVYSFLTFGIVCGFMVVKGNGIKAIKDLDLGIQLGIAAGVGVFFGIIAQLFFVPWCRRTILERENIPYWQIFNINCIPVGSKGYYDAPGKKDAEVGQGEMAAMQQMAAMPVSYDMYGQPVQPLMMGQQYPVVGSNFGASDAKEDMVGIDESNRRKVEDGGMLAKIAPGFFMEIGAPRPEDSAMHGNAFQGDSQSEEMFKILQVSSCFFFTISHGANDMANAVAPLASVWMVYSTGLVSSKAEIPFWILLYGGIAMDIGIITMGHHIMAALGNRLTLMTPSRGFCIEIGAMLTVLVASKFGLPVSTTHCMTGATTGVGLCNGSLGAVNWKLLAIIAFGWVLTCPAAGVVTGLVFWGLAATPSPTPGNGFFEGAYHG
jgi:phosphate/sulfate permease